MDSVEEALAAASLDEPQANAQMQQEEAEEEKKKETEENVDDDEDESSSSLCEVGHSMLESLPDSFLHRLFDHFRDSFPKKHGAVAMRLTDDFHRWILAFRLVSKRCNLVVLGYHGFHLVSRPRLLRAAGTGCLEDLQRVVELTQGSRRAPVLLPALLATTRAEVIDFVAEKQRFDDALFPWGTFSQQQLDIMLHAAARRGSAALIAALLDAGDASGDGGGDPLAQGQLALETAVREGHVEAVDTMLAWLWARHTVKRGKAKEKKRTRDKVVQIMSHPSACLRTSPKAIASREARRSRRKQRARQGKTVDFEALEKVLPGDEQLGAMLGVLHTWMGRYQGDAREAEAAEEA